MNFSSPLGKMHKLHPCEIGWDLCPLPPTAKAAIARQRSPQQCSEESFLSYVSATSFQAATSRTTSIPSPSWTSSFTPTPAAHGLERSKTWSTQHVSLLNTAYLLSIGLQLMISEFVAGQQKEKKKRKKILPSVNFSVWIYLNHTCWVNIQWKNSELWGVKTNQNDPLDRVAAFVCILLKIYLDMTVVWLAMSDRSLVIPAGTCASVALIAAIYKLVQHNSLRNLLSFPQQYCIQILIWINNCKDNFLPLVLQVEFPWKF